MQFKENDGDIQNYNKTPSYAYVYERRNKLKTETLHPLKEINSTREKGGNSITATGPTINNNPQSLKEHKQSHQMPCLCDYICSNSSVDEFALMNDVQKRYEECDKTTPYPLSNYLTFTSATSPYRTFLTSLKDDYIPRTSDKAMPHSMKAMEEELRALEENQTWELVKLSSHKKPIRCRWVFTIKYLSDRCI